MQLVLQGKDHGPNVPNPKNENTDGLAHLYAASSGPHFAEMELRSTWLTDKVEPASNRRLWRDRSRMEV